MGSTASARAITDSSSSTGERSFACIAARASAAVRLHGSFIRAPYPSCSASGFDFAERGKEDAHEASDAATAVDVIDRRRAGGGGSMPGLGGGGGWFPRPGPRWRWRRAPDRRQRRRLLLIVVIVVFAVCIAPKIFGSDSGFGDVFSGLGQAQDGTGIDPANDPDLETKQFVNDVVSDVEETWGQLFAGSNTTFRPADLDPVHRHHADRVRAGLGGDRPFLLPGRFEDLPGHELLQGAGAAVRRAGRLRAGVRDRSRVRPPHPEPAGDQRAGAAAVTAGSEPGERPVGRGWNCRPTASPACGVTR